MKKNKKITIYFVIFSLLLIGIIYAILQANLQINGTAKIGANTWDIHFNNIQVNANSVAIGTGDTAATIDPDNNCKVDFSVTLSLPGDFYEFTVDVVNAGTIDGMIGELTKTIKVNNETVSEIPDYLNYIVTYSDGTEILENHALDAGTTETYLVRLEYKTNIEELPEAATIETSLEPQYIQADNNVIPVRTKTATFDTGKVVQVKLSLINRNPEATGQQYVPYSGQEWSTSYSMTDGLKKADSLGQFDTSDVTHIISSPDSNYPIYVWYEDWSIKWYTEAEVIYLNEDSSYLFYNYPGGGFDSNFFDLLDMLDTSRVQNMSYMFNSNYNIAHNLNNIDRIIDWDVSNVIDMSYMFHNCLYEAPIGFTLASLNDWDIRNVTNFTGMFSYSQMDRSGIVSGSSVNDIIFPTFSLRPGTWNKSISGQYDMVDGTYIPNN